MSLVRAVALLLFLVCTLTQTCVFAQDEKAEPAATPETKFTKTSGPHLFLTSADLQAIKALRGKQPWVEPFIAHLKEVTDARMAQPFALPAEGSGNAPHFELSDIMNLRSEAIALGLLFHLTGDENYAEREITLLLKYAEKYPGYPETEQQGRALDTAAHEARWAMGLAWGYDLCRSRMNDDQRQIFDAFMKTLAAQILRGSEADSVESMLWAKAGVLVLGCVLDSNKYANAVLNGSDSIIEILATRTGPTQLADPAGWAAQAAHCAGFKNVETAASGLFRGIMKTVDADKSEQNDSIKRAAGWLEWAFEQYRDSRYSAALSVYYASGNERTGDLVFLFARRDLPQRQ